MIDAKQRKVYGKAGQTMAEAVAAKATRTERDEQSLFANLLRQRKERGELLYDWSATHKANTNMPGRADFWIAARNSFLQIEFKRIDGKLSAGQKREKDCSEAAGVDYHVVFFAEEAYRLLLQWLNGIGA